MTDKQADTERERQIEIHTDRKTDRQRADRERERQTE